MKRVVGLLVFFFVLCGSISFSQVDYSVSDANKDSRVVASFFSGSGSEDEASKAFSRLYSFAFKDSSDYVLNRSKGKFHKPNCSGVKTMNESNKVFVTCSRDLVISFGYTPCSKCNP